jgi:hypothetical protein
MMACTGLEKIFETTSRLKSNKSRSLYDRRQHKTRLSLNTEKFVDHRKRVALQWLQDRNQINADCVNCVRLNGFTQFEKRARRNLKSKLMRSKKTARTVM